MDTSPIINQLVGALWYLIPIVILVAIFKSPWFKGIVGEFIVNSSTELKLDEDEYHLIKNVTLPTEDGTTQIDHVIVSIYGVFVVETKNMKGWIFGDADQKMWTQKIFKHSSSFQNPLHQNYKHTKTLKQLLGLKDDQIHSLVVFIGDSTFKTDMPENVTNGRGYIRYIKAKKQSVLSVEKVTEIINKIESNRLSPSIKTHREHVNHVKSKTIKKQSSNACPKCGSPMVLRQAKKGRNEGKQFWGCSRYPQCKGVVNIT